MVAGRALNRCLPSRTGELAESSYAFSLTAERRKLTMPPAGFHSDRMPAFSPDGTSLAFCRLPGGFYLLPLDANLAPAGDARRVTNHKRWSAQPLWTPDGRNILYVFGDHAGKGREVRMVSASTRAAQSETVLISDSISEIAYGQPDLLTTDRRHQ
jgi:Tol biopolymer transport system component